MDSVPGHHQHFERHIQLSELDTDTDLDLANTLRIRRDSTTSNLSGSQISSQFRQDVNRVPTHTATTNLHDNSSVREQTQSPELQHDIAHAEPEYRMIPVPEGFLALDYRPAILTGRVTLALAALYSAIIAGICALTYKSDQTNKYTIVNPNIYMAARFGPALVGTVTTVLVRTFLSELCRMLPYISMADGSTKYGNAKAVESIAAMYYPNLGSLTVTSQIIITLQLITTPLMAVKLALLEVVVTSDGWSLIVHPSVALSLIAYYAIQILVLLVVTAWLWTKTTGLRSDWDPVSLADVIALFQNFNVEQEFFQTPADATARLWPLHQWKFRLGYWEVKTCDEATDDISSRPAIVYGIRGTLTSGESLDSRLRELNRPVERLRMGPLTPLFNSRWYEDRFNIRARFQRASEHYASQPDFPYRFLPILSFGRAIWMAKAALGGCLLVAIVAVACVQLTSQLFTIDQGNGFGMANETLLLANVSNPNLTAAGSIFFLRGSQEEQDRLTLWNFILRTIPVTVAGMIILISGHFSRYHNYIRPFQEMLTGPSPANTTILLDYMTLSGISILLQAWEHCHWKVLSFAMLNMLGPIAMLVPTGMLILTSKDGVIYGSFSRGFVIASAVVLAIYLGAYVYGYCTAKQRYPRWGTSLIDIWALCFSSRLAHYPEFAECRPGWTKKDMVATLQLRSDKYLLGVVRGTDGLERAGFEVATIDRQENSTGAVLYVSPKHPYGYWHCAACSVDDTYHVRTDQARLRLLKQHYRFLDEPIDLPRGFEHYDSETSSLSRHLRVQAFSGAAGSRMANTGDESNDANAVGGIGVAAGDEE
jgi:hypothetical protein